MDQLTLEEKQQQFHEFFTIKHNLRINAVLVPESQPLPHIRDLEENMPYAFRIASEVSDIDAKAIRSLRHLSDSASELADYLNHLSHKIDLVMSYVLRQEDEEDHQFESVEFGGGGITIRSEEEMKVGSSYELKVFLESEASAIFCYGEVISCVSNEEQYNVSFIFTRIREQDQELLVRASLHLQTQQLKKRSQSEQ